MPAGGTALKEKRKKLCNHFKELTVTDAGNQPNKILTDGMKILFYISFDVITQLQRGYCVNYHSNYTLSHVNLICHCRQHIQYRQ